MIPDENTDSGERHADDVREFVDVSQPPTPRRRERSRPKPEPKPENHLAWERSKRLSARRTLIVTLTIALVFALIMLHSARRHLPDDDLAVFSIGPEIPITLNAFEIVVLSIMGIAWLMHATVVVRLLSAEGGRKTAATFHIVLLVGWLAYVILFCADSHTDFVMGLVLPFIWIVAPLALIDGLADRPSWKSFWGDVFD